MLDGIGIGVSIGAAGCMGRGDAGSTVSRSPGTESSGGISDGRIWNEPEFEPVTTGGAGGSVMRTRTQAVLLNGAFVGLGGAFLSVITTGTFTAFMTGGLGFVAIVITMLSRGKVHWIVITSLIYGIAVAIKNPLQLVGVTVPADVFQMLPFVVVMLTLIIFARSSVVPPALGTSYTRGAR